MSTSRVAVLVSIGPSGTIASTTSSRASDSAARLIPRGIVAHSASGQSCSTSMRTYAGANALYTA